MGEEERESTTLLFTPVHFLIILITALLQLKLKQDCIFKMKITQNNQQNQKKITHSNKNETYSGLNASYLGQTHQSVVIKIEKHSRARIK